MALVDNILNQLLYSRSSDLKAIREDLALIGTSYVQLTADGMKRLDPKDVLEPTDGKKPGPQ